MLYEIANHLLKLAIHSSAVTVHSFRQVRKRVNHILYVFYAYNIKISTEKAINNQLRCSHFLIICGKWWGRTWGSVGEAKELGIEYTDDVLTIGEAEGTDPVLSIDSTSQIPYSRTFYHRTKQGEVILVRESICGKQFRLRSPVIRCNYGRCRFDRRN
jgi:hypothetical protein